MDHIETKILNSYTIQEAAQNMVFAARLALGFPEDSADVRIAQYEADARKPRDEILAKMAKILYVPIDVLTVPVLSEPREYDAASFWMHELSAEL